MNITKGKKKIQRRAALRMVQMPKNKKPYLPSRTAKNQPSFSTATSDTSDKRCLDSASQRHVPNQKVSA